MYFAVSRTSGPQLPLRPFLTSRHVAPRGLLGCGCQLRRYANISNNPLTSTPVSIIPSTQELHDSHLSPQNLEKAITSLHIDGLVVVQNVINHKHLDGLNTVMVRDALELQSRKEASPYNYNKGNIQQDPPPVCQAYSFDADSIASQISNTHLGPLPKWTFCSANTALPPTEDSPPQSQPVHSDADFDHPNIPFALVVNVPLVDMSQKNGSTEIWLGTHVGSSSEAQKSGHGDRASGQIKLDLLEARRAIRPPSQPEIPKGSIIIRDLRLWHAGKPNLSDSARVMLAMIHFAPWYRNKMRLEFATDVQDIINREKDLEIPVDWVERGDIMKTYLNRGFGNSYDFDQKD